MAGTQPNSKWASSSHPTDEPNSSSSSPLSPHLDTEAPWSRPRIHRNQSSRRRLSEPINRVRQSPVAYARRVLKSYYRWGLRMLDRYQKLDLVHQLAIAGFLALALVLVIVTILFSKAFFQWLGPVAEKWRALRGGWLIAFTFIFITSFPPVILYSTANSVAGFVYGFPMGWPIAASACIIGSLCAFIASRTVLSGYVDRLVGKDARFMALGQVLRKEGILYLTAIRFCPLPFSLSNGFLATIPSITPLSFAISTALSTPKLLVHIFIGSRIALLVKDNGEMSFHDKAINWLSMIVGGAVGLAVGYVIYRRTMARAAAIALEQEQEDAEEGRSVLYSANSGDRSYADDTLLDPEDAAAVMSEDDISMWGEHSDDGFEDENEDGKYGSNGSNGKR